MKAGVTCSLRSQYQFSRGSLTRIARNSPHAFSVHVCVAPVRPRVSVRELTRHLAVEPSVLLLHTMEETAYLW